MCADHGTYSRTHQSQQHWRKLKIVYSRRDTHTDTHMPLEEDTRGRDISHRINIFVISLFVHLQHCVCAWLCVLCFPNRYSEQREQQMHRRIATMTVTVDWDGDDDDDDNNLCLSINLHFALRNIQFETLFKHKYPADRLPMCTTPPPNGQQPHSVYIFRMNQIKHSNVSDTAHTQPYNIPKANDKKKIIRR